MDFGISQGGCFDRTIIVQGFARFPGQEARLCRAECPPHFLFVLPKRKRAGHGTKEKALRDELTGKAANSPIRRSGRYALPTKSRTHLPAALYLNLNQCAAASAGMEHNGVQIGHPLLLFPLPLPHPQEGFPKGRDLCAKGPFPLPRSGNCPLREQTVLSDFQIK